MFLTCVRARFIFTAPRNPLGHNLRGKIKHHTVSVCDTNQILFDYFLAAFGLLAPYLERACFLLATPAVSRVPLMM